MNSMRNEKDERGRIKYMCATHFSASIIYGEYKFSVKWTTGS